MITIKIFKLISLILLISFIICYAISSSGYYEYKLSNKKELTSEMIEKFEEDVKNNEDIDINNYIVNDNIDYSNKLSKGTYKISTKLNNILNKGIKNLFKFASKLVEE